MDCCFVGDVHGMFDEFGKLIDGFPKDYFIFQLGDFGIGFDYRKDFERRDNVYFVRGNHDNPLYCKGRRDYLGDYGYLDSLDLFFVSGADSIDKDTRIQFKNWWPDENLNYEQFSKAIELYEEKRPKIVIAE